MAREPVRLSVIIPTRDRGELLRDCLCSLREQDVDQGSLEVIVVDDGSSQRLDPIVEESHSGARVIRQEQSGLNEARNRGVRESAAPTIAFLDDDTLVDRGWARALISAFDRERPDAIAGRILLAYEGPVPRWLWHPAHGYLSGLDLGDEPHWLRLPELPFGANCATSRAAFDRVGGFSVGLDRNGTSLISGGETEFFRRIAQSGGQLLYVPAARVLHRVPAERLTARYFLRRGYAQGITDVLMQSRSGAISTLCHLVLDLGWFARAPLILAKGLLLGRGATGAGIWSAMVLGRLRGRLLCLRRSAITLRVSSAG